MFENFHTTEKEKPAPEKIHTDFETKEKRERKRATDFLENLTPEKFKEKAARALAAACLVFAATSAAAGEQENNYNLPEMGEEQVVQTRGKITEKNNIADFDWQKIATKIQISIGTTKEDIKDFHTESISPWWNLATNAGIQENESEFYKGVTSVDAYEAYISEYNALELSHNASEFFTNLPVLSEKGFPNTMGMTPGLSDKQKVLMLQDFGYFLNNTYNFDMLNSGEFVMVSDDKMFEALRGQVIDGSTIVSGTCGNIHTFLVKTAESLGIEAWLQGGTVSTEEGKGGHVWSGMIVGSGSEKQIVFLNYGTLIPTGTLDYQDALGVAERHFKSVSVLNTFVGNSAELLFPVKSRAQEVVGKAVGAEESVDRLGRNLLHGEIEKQGRSLEINIGSEIKEIKLGNDSVGLAFFKFEDTQNNPYQSLKDLSAWRGRVGASNENVGVEVGATVLNLNIKDLNGGTFSTEELVVTLATDYIDKKQLTKNQYGEFIVEWGATIEAAVSKQLSSEGKGSKNSITGGQADGTSGGRLVYLDPNNIEKVYFEASETVRGTFSDFQNQKLTTNGEAINFAVGAEVKVFEGNVVNIEVGKSNLDWGKSFDIKSGLSGGKFKGEVSYEKKESDYERFIPSSQKVEVGVTYKSGPKWEVDIIGARTTEKYKDAQSKNISSAEVKLKIFLR